MKNLKKIKKQLNVSFLFLLYFLVFTINNDQNKLTKGQWQSDLTWLQKKIHKDYPHLFYNISGDEFDSAVGRLRRNIPLLSENEIRTEFFRLVALLKIGHTGIKFKYGENPDSLKAMFHYYPVNKH